MFVETVFVIEVCQANQKAKASTLCSQILSETASGDFPSSVYSRLNFSLTWLVRNLFCMLRQTMDFFPSVGVPFPCVLQGASSACLSSGRHLSLRGFRFVSLLGRKSQETCFLRGGGGVGHCGASLGFEPEFQTFLSLSHLEDRSSAYSSTAFLYKDQSLTGKTSP